MRQREADLQDELSQANASCIVQKIETKAWRDTVWISNVFWVIIIILILWG